MSKEFQTKKVPTAVIPDDKLSKVYLSPNIIEAVTVDKRSCNIRKFKRVGKNACVNMSTGEYIEFSKNENLQSKQAHFKKAANDLRRIINLNFIGDCSEKFITLTYCNRMEDYNNASEDFKKFWSLFKYRYPNCEYIRILEPQESGSWHIHVLIKDKTKKNFYVKHEVLSSLWGHGKVWIKNLPFSENFGAYFCAQFNSTDNSNEESKAIQKGKRIDYYPSNFKFYTCSKGIEKPKPIVMSHGELKRLVNYQEPCYAYTNTIADNDVVVNSITFEQYLNAV
ncbi:MAG TPA: hypothetical protein DD413_01125 [Ruminococcus sp.]|nr:hypothetical protein [Ruminococcus sp.]